MGRLGRAIQQIATRQVEAGKPVDITDGYYLGEGQARLPDNLIVDIVIPQHLTDWEVDMELEDNYDKLHTGRCPGAEGDCTPVEHKGKVKMKIYNHLEVGDHLLIIKYPMRGKFVAIDRLVDE